MKYKDIEIIEEYKSTENTSFQKMGGLWEGCRIF